MVARRSGRQAGRVVKAVLVELLAMAAGAIVTLRRPQVVWTPSTIRSHTLKPTTTQRGTSRAADRWRHILLAVIAGLLGLVASLHWEVRLSAERC
jgi:hypothetical protein